MNDKICWIYNNDLKLSDKNVYIDDEEYMVYKCDNCGEVIYIKVE